MSPASARRAFERILLGVERQHELARRDALLGLLAGVQDHLRERGDAPIPVAVMRDLLAKGGVELPSEAAVKMAVVRATP